MHEILTKSFYGNTVQDWFVAGLIVICALVAGKAFYWSIGRVIKRVAAKTKTKLDDIVVDMAEEPFVFAVVVAGIWFGLLTLTLPAMLRNLINNACYILLTLNVAWLLVRLLDALTDEYVVPFVRKSDSDLDDQLLPILRKGLRFLIWTLGVIVGANNAGYDIGAILAGLGIGGLAFALAAQDTVSNLFGGITIFLDKPFRVQDRVKISGFDGTIREIGMRSTRLQTLEGRVVTIPNAAFTDSPVENVSSEPSRKVVLNLGLTYDTDHQGMELGMKLLKEILAENKDTEDKVLVSFNAFGDFALGILLIYYIKKGSDILDTQTAVNMEILKRFNENKLDFAFPTQTICMAK